ncbi:MAG: DivIVA domain-containing protein [Chroococcales cyanobacterium]
MILESPRLPLVGRTIIDEDQLLDQLDLVRINLPEAFAQALEILRQRDEILQQAQEYGEDLIAAAERSAAQILDETRIIQQAELQARRIREQVKRECEELQEQTLSEVEQMRLESLQELDQLRQLALAECEDIQEGADDYADSVLVNIEQQLTDMLRVIRNGREKLETNARTKRISRQDYSRIKDEE